MTQVALSLGSNIRRYYHINEGLSALERLFGAVECSPVYESAAVGFDGSPFLNLIAVIETQNSIHDVILALKKIEDDNGRERQGPRFAPRTLDIDVVTFGQCFGMLEDIMLPRPELFKNAFVLLPLVDLWPHERVPGTEMTYEQLWQEQGDSSQQLHIVPFERR